MVWVGIKKERAVVLKTIRALLVLTLLWGSAKAQDDLLETARAQQTIAENLALLVGS